jgi:ATP-dependent protease ClpP protease subunit
MISLLSVLFLSFTQLNYGFNQISRRSLIVSSMNLNPLYKISLLNVSEDTGENNGLINCIKNHIYFSGPLTEESIFAISSNVIAMQYRDNNEINLHIKSQGGSLLPTLGLVDIIRTSDIPINTYIDGYVASAATLLSIVGSNRLINKHGVMLIHQLKMGADYSKYSEIKDYAKNADTLMDIIKDLYLEYTNISPNNLEYLLAHDLWLNSSTCKEYGLVDIII